MQIAVRCSGADDRSKEETGRDILLLLLLLLLLEMSTE